MAGGADVTGASSGGGKSRAGLDAVGLERLTREALAAGAARNMAVDLRLVLNGVEVRVAGVRPGDQQSYAHIQVVEWERLAAADDPAAVILAAVEESVERTVRWLRARMPKQD